MNDQEIELRLERLKFERQKYIQQARTRVKAANAAIKKIKTRLAESPATVPELAEAIGLSTRETLWYIAALKKYGQVNEGAKSRRDKYYPYELIAGSSREGEPNSSDGNN